MQLKKRLAQSLPFASLFICCLAQAGVDPPKPFGPVPTPAQLAWQQDEFTFFVHFNIDTFTGLNLGLGNEDPKLFNPTDLDCNQWVKVANDVGAKGIILTAKHHDGFCIWQTATTDHSVKSSTWRDGKGDVVREFSDACKAGNIKMGIYCSPWDRSQPTYDTDKPAYQKLYKAQLTELLSNYGPVYEMWFDGNKANIAAWPEVIKTVRALQPNAVIKQGPRVTPVQEDMRWVGNELACAPLTNWSVDPPPDGKDAAPGGGAIWFPRESDTMLIGHWFWDGTPPRDLDTLLNFYYYSVGRNSMLILNVAPDKRGKFSDESITRLHEFRAAIDSIFKTNLAAGKIITATNTRGNDPAFSASNILAADPTKYWATDDNVTSASLEIDLGAPTDFNVIRAEEMISLGQRVEEYKVEALEDTGWKTISTGTTIGYRKLDRFPKVTATKVRFTIVKSLACPVIRSFGIHLDTVSLPKDFDPKVALFEVKPRSR